MGMDVHVHVHVFFMTADDMPEFGITWNCVSVVTIAALENSF